MEHSYDFLLVQAVWTIIGRTVTAAARLNRSPYRKTRPENAQQPSPRFPLYTRQAPNPTQYLSAAWITSRFFQPKFQLSLREPHILGLRTSLFCRCGREDGHRPLHSSSRLYFSAVLCLMFPTMQVYNLLSPAGPLLGSVYTPQHVPHPDSPSITRKINIGWKARLNYRTQVRYDIFP